MNKERKMSQEDQIIMKNYFIKDLAESKDNNNI